MRKPFSPDQAIARAKAEIPEEVIEAFEEMIVKHLSHGRARFKLKDVAALAAEKLEVATSTLLDNHWMDVGGLFRDAGWAVKYEPSPSGETYKDMYTFRAKRKAS